ncbi:MAG: class I SAM-dependent methyltransferase [Bacteroidia bacterium]|jgi:2-polyprenyl-6-hydroxyphenyl methylase/3-demethylubiquinone-9 3-methyltransferase|nr:class I SAM-dependent methyltransferase [Bacteroidia bacterium]
MPGLKWKAAQYFESRWWRWYLRKKESEEYLQWKLNYWKTFLDTIGENISLKPDGNYLDLGCGPAGIFMALPGNVVAVDPLIEKYQQDFPSFFQKYEGKMLFLQAKAEEFSSTYPYDIVFCLNVINHVDDIVRAMGNLRSLCKQGGTIVVSVDEHRWQMLHHIFRWLPFDVLHPHQLSRSGFEKLLISNGFEIVYTTILKTELIFRYRVWVARCS